MSTNIPKPTVPPPVGSEFRLQELIDEGSKIQAWILHWLDPKAMVEYYSPEGVLAICNGTSLNVTFERIGRGKGSVDERAKKMVDYRPRATTSLPYTDYDGNRFATMAEAQASTKRILKVS